MKNKKIFITGDDGYNAIGLKLLIKLLSKDNEITCLVTKEQQSGVGGAMKFKPEVSYEIHNIEGVKVFAVDGTPVDAVNIADSFANEKFDLIISGINLGENVSSAIISSGTFAAGVRAVGKGLAEHAVILSMKNDWKKYFSSHSTDELDNLLKYPGEQVLKILNYTENNNYYGKKVVNINFPDEPTEQYVMTKVDPLWKNYYYQKSSNDSENKIIRADFSKYYADELSSDMQYDTGALTNGLISITPIDFI